MTTETAKVSQLGPYRLHKCIATSPTGEVYLASHVHAPARVALRRYPKEILDDAGTVSLLLQTLERVRALTHPNIAKVRDIVHHEDQLLVAVDYVEGVNLHQVLSRVHSNGTELPVDAALHVAVSVLRALDHFQRPAGGADDDGLIHGGLWPSNVLVSRDGDVLVNDFGAWLLAAALQKGELSPSLRTRYSYRSPEHVTGDKLTCASDLFCVGIITYELVAGRPLWRGESLMETLEQVEAALPPPWEDFRAPGLVPLLTRALHVDPVERYQQAAPFLVDLLKTWPSAAPEVGRSALAKWLVPLCQAKAPVLPDAARGAGPVSGPGWDDTRPGPPQSALEPTEAQLRAPAEIEEDDRALDSQSGPFDLGDDEGSDSRSLEQLLASVTGEVIDTGEPTRIERVERVVDSLVVGEEPTNREQDEAPLAPPSLVSPAVLWNDEEQRGAERASNAPGHVSPAWPASADSAAGSDGFVVEGITGAGLTRDFADEAPTYRAAQPVLDNLRPSIVTVLPIRTASETASTAPGKRADGREAALEHEGAAAAAHHSRGPLHRTESITTADEDLLEVLGAGRLVPRSASVDPLAQGPTFDFESNPKPPDLSADRGDDADIAGPVAPSPDRLPFPIAQGSGRILAAGDGSAARSNSANLSSVVGFGSESGAVSPGGLPSLAERPRRQMRFTAAHAILLVAIVAFLISISLLVRRMLTDNARSRRQGASVHGPGQSGARVAGRAPPLIAGPSQHGAATAERSPAIGDAAFVARGTPRPALQADRDGEQASARAVRITSTPSAVLYVDGKELGSTPAEVSRTAGQSIAIALLAPQYAMHRQTVTVAPGPAQTVEVKLSKGYYPRAKGKRRGWILVRCAKGDHRRVLLDGNDTGFGCPQVGFSLNPGAYRIAFAAVDGTRSPPRRVQVRWGRRTLVRAP